MNFLDKLVKAMRKMQYKVYKKIIVYERVLSSVEDTSLCSFLLEPMTSEDLLFMEVKYKDEISEKKKALLKKRLQENSSVTTFVIKDKEGKMYGYYHADDKETVNTRVSYTKENPTGTVYFFDDYTFNDLRKRGAHKASIHLRMAHYKENGYERATVQIMPENKASRRVYESCGFTPSGTIKRIRIGKREIIQEQNYS